MRGKTYHQTRIHVSLSLSTIESLFNLAKYRFWSGEAIPGVRRPVFIRVRTAELELELIQTQMAQKPMLRAEVGMRVRCANKASAE